MPETSIQCWKSRPIFISSTFRDMHVERDRLRQHVFPRLEEELLKRRHHLEWIDLRQGVDSGAASTEEERELLVLKVCLDEIKRSRPFLIVLLGDRYGWVPPADRMDAAVDEAGFSAEVHGRSVTALEIEFGILKESPDQQHRCFFYVRDPLPYDEMPPEVRATYSEQFADDDLAAARWSALEELKKRLTEDDELRQRIRPYSARWDSEKNTVTGLEKWGDDVFEDLWRELEKETREFAAKPAPTWEEFERDALAEFVEHRSRDFTGRHDVTQQLLDLAKSPVALAVSADASAASTTVPWGACVTGPPGAGKSALFAKLVSELEHDPNVLLLANAAGTSPRSASVDAMLRRWIAELAGFLSVNDPLPEKASVEEVDQTFASLLSRASVKQRVVVLLDALNQFEPTPRAKHMTWRPKLWPPNVRFLATALPGAEAESVSQWAGVEEIELPPLTEADAREIGHNVCRRYHCPWSDAVWQVLAAKTLPNTRGVAVGNPLWTTLACEQLALLDADDFARAERQFADERDPQARLTQLRRDLAEQMPPDVPGLYAWLLAQTEKIHGEARARAFAVAIAHSRHGWRERDLRLLVPALALLLYPQTPAAEISPLQLAALRRSFRAHLAVRGENQQWDFFHVQMRETIVRHNLADSTLVPRIHTAIADHLEALPPEDPLRQWELMVHLISASDRVRAARYYASDLGTTEEIGATQALALHVVSGASEDPIVWIASLLTQEGLDLAHLGAIATRFTFNLARALENRAGVLARLYLLRAAEHVLSELVDSDPSHLDWQKVLAMNRLLIGDMLAGKGDSASALEAYRTALTTAEHLSALDPKNVEAHRAMMMAASNIGNVLCLRANENDALAAYRQSLAVAERATALDPSDTIWQRDVSVNHVRIGDLLRRQGDEAGALAAYRAALAIRERLAAADWTRVAWTRDVQVRDVLVCQTKIGDTLRDQGDTTGAIVALRRALETAERLIAFNPRDLAWQRELSVVHSCIGSALLQQRDTGGALTAFLDSLSIRESLGALDPANALWQDDLWRAYDNVGVAAATVGDLDGAIAAYRAAVAVARHLAALDSDVEAWQLHLWNAHEAVADVLLKAADVTGAIAAYGASILVLEELTHRYPNNLEHLRHLAQTHNTIGSVLSDQGDARGSVAAYRAGLAVAERLSKSDPDDAELQRDIAISHAKIGDLLRAEGDAEGAFTAYTRCRNVLHTMKTRGMRLDPAALRVLEQLEDLPAVGAPQKEDSKMASFTPDELEQIATEFKARARRIAFATSAGVEGAIDWTINIAAAGKAVGICLVKSDPRQSRLLHVTIGVNHTVGAEGLQVVVALGKEHLLCDLSLANESTQRRQGGMFWTVTATPPPLGTQRASNIDMALLDAAQRGDIETVRARLAAGVDVNARNLAGISPLFFAVAEGHREIAALLIDRGANVHGRTSNGLVPLVMAAHKGDRAMVELLLARGADVNDANSDGSTALKWALQRGHPEVAELLRRAGGQG